MNTPRTHRSSRSRRSRKLSAAFGSLGLATTLAFSGLVGEGVEETEAAWNDTEAATAEIKAMWPTEWFARTVGNSWQSVNTVNVGGISYPRREDFGPGENFAVFSRISTESQSPAGSSGNPTRQSTVGGGGFTRVDSLASSNWETSPKIWMGRTDGEGRAITRHCIDDPKSIVPLANGCVGGVPNAFVESAHSLENLSLSITTDGVTSLKSGRLNANGISTSVRCFSPGSSQTPQAALVIPRPASLPSDKASARISVAEQSSAISTGYDDERLALLPSASSDATGTLNDGVGPWFRANINDMNGTSGRLTWFVRIRTDRFVQQEPMYAKSEVTAEIQLYSAHATGLSDGRYVGSVNVVLSRSECGVGRYPTRDFLYNGADQAGRVQDQPNWTVPFFPTDTVPSGSTGLYTPPLNRVLGAQVKSLRGTDVNDAATSELPPTTTVTSPSEHTNASETTTSAPPDPSATDPAESTNSPTTTTTTRLPTTTTAAATAASATTTPPATQTTATTSAAPVIVVPAEPLKLSPAARLEEAGIAEVDGKELVVVVKGDNIPADARQGVAALEVWLGGGNPGPTWATYTSDDPDEDGWRWAAINQKTGTVVYIR